MSAEPANLAVKGAAALTSQDYASAITYYTQAIAGLPTSVDYYIKRSTAYQRSANYPSALSDAEIAVVLAQRRGHRELLSTAQLRRGISLLLMGRYGDAGVCFGWAEKYNDKDKSIGFWQKKLEMDFAKIDEDDVRREVTIKEFPDAEVPKPVAANKPAPNPAGGDSGRVEELPDDYEEPRKLDKGKGKAVEEPTKAEAPPPPQGVTTPADKIRHEWYQTNTSVSVSLFVKGVPKDQTTVELEERSLSITFPLANGSDFSFTLDPLAYPIKSSESTYKIMGTKVEFTLIKSEPGKKWSALESAEAVGAAMSPSTTQSPKPADKPPAYPTSSRHGPKNWDKVVNDLTSASKAKKSTAKDSKDNKDSSSTSKEDDIDYADLDDDDLTNDPVNGFFKKLYKDADPDTRKAMMKSYQESNGTALSTNWSEVKKGKVETSPPDGMEAKQWGT